MRTLRNYRRLEDLTRRWWFYLLLLYIYFFAPPYSSTAGFITERASELVAEVLSQSLKPYKPFMPTLHIIVILLITALLIYGNRVRKPFTAFIGVNYLLIAFLQDTTITEKYGLGIITGNIIWFFIIGLLWLWDVKVEQQTIHSVGSHPGGTWLYL
jgi:hypothetical protein